ncbi:MAG: NUDIX hydrolase, partial [Gammaproteobacteria bacterium]|nr:NUDIX hydrolase [Gammaproteobacteria bacterium]
AIRECFEESGVLLARDRQGGLLSPGSALEASRFADYRGLLLAGSLSLADLCREEGLTLAADQLTYFSYWITPVVAPRRYATRFFVAAAPPRQAASHDGRESLEARWLSPRAALADESLVLPPPTRHTLRQFAAAADVAEALACARRLLRAGIQPILPVVTGQGAAARVSIPSVADDERPEGMPHG